MRDLTTWKDLPTYVIADDGDERTFVIRLHQPRFVMEIITDATGHNAGSPLFIDDPGELSGAEGTRLMHEAGDFYAREISRED